MAPTLPAHVLETGRLSYPGKLSKQKIPGVAQTRHPGFFILARENWEDDQPNKPMYFVLLVHRKAAALDWAGLFCVGFGHLLFHFGGCEAIFALVLHFGLVIACAAHACATCLACTHEAPAFLRGGIACTCNGGAMLGGSARRQCGLHHEKGGQNQESAE